MIRRAFWRYAAAWVGLVATWLERLAAIVDPCIVCRHLDHPEGECASCGCDA